MTPDPPRWRYRLDNYTRALTLLREAIGLMEARELSALEREGVIQRFEYTWELAWKLLRDYLGVAGVQVQTVTPRSVLRAAFAAGLIAAGDTWMEALDARNRMAHTYNLKTFEAIVAAIHDRYFPLLEGLHDTMLALALEEDL